MFLLETYEKSDALVVELKDLVKEKDHYFVYMIENNQAVKKPVVIGKQYQIECGNIDGLMPGEKLLSKVRCCSKPDAKVRIIE